MRLSIASFSALALAAIGCGKAGTAPPDAGAPPAEFPVECENINPTSCLMPWPSSRYLVDDGTTPTGRRIQVPVEAMPSNSARVPIDPSIIERFDGFSPATSLITSFSGILDTSNLPDERNIDGSLDAASPTVILDAETGERVAHFAEVDMWPDMDPEQRPFYIRPAARLEEGRRYVVGIRNLSLQGGQPVEPSAYFRALRDGTTLEGADDLEARRAHFEGVFSVLEAAGIPRDNLIEAWDFETASGPSIYGDLLAMRDDALLALDDDPEPRCAIVAEDQEPPNGIFRRLEGTIRVPLFLNGPTPSAEDSRIHRDEAGRPSQNGWADVPFTMNIPESVRDRVASGGPPARLVDYGHGLFGTRSEGNTSWLRDTLMPTEMVGIAIDWWGMSTDDVARLFVVLREFSGFPSVPERLGQALINHVVLHRAFRDGCADLVELQIPLDGGVDDDTAPAIDHEQIYYYGNSQGGIMGIALAGIAVDVERFVLGVGGMTYSLMIPRSTAWQTYGAVMRRGYGDALTRALIMVIGQSQWDLGEASTFAPHVLDSPLPCDSDVCSGGLTPTKRVLFQIGRDDALVANVTSEVAARTMGLAYVHPAPFEPWNLPSISANLDAVLGESAMVIFDIPNTPTLPPGTRDPIDGNPAHEGVRRAPEAIEQIDLFLRPDGLVMQTCASICGSDD